MDLVVAIVIALSLDYWLGEPKRLHPLVGFGALADGLEQWLNGPVNLFSLRASAEADQPSMKAAPRRNNLLKLKRLTSPSAGRWTTWFCRLQPTTDLGPACHLRHDFLLA